MSSETEDARVIHRLPTALLRGRMTAKITRLRPKRHDRIAEAGQLLLDMPLGLKDATRDDLAEALGRFEPPPHETWKYAMMNPDQLRQVLKAINASPKPLSTLRVWTAVLSRIRYDTGEVMAGGRLLADDAGTTPQEVSRALNRLVEIGALLRLRRGRYAVNPHVAWVGSLDRREVVAMTTSPVQLHLVGD